MCFLIGFFIVGAPTIQALQYSSSGKVNLLNQSKRVENENKDEIRQTIIERLNEFKGQKLSIMNFIKFGREDPDGPLNGGLDDTRDWISLFFGLIELNACISEIIDFLKNPSFLNLWLVGLYTWATYVYLGEAFDLVEFFEDGR